MKINADFDVEFTLYNNIHDDFYIVNPIKVVKKNETYTFLFKTDTQLCRYIELNGEEVDCVDMEFKAVCTGLDFLKMIEYCFDFHYSYEFSNVYDLKIKKIKYEEENEYINYNRFTPEEKRKFEKEIKYMILEGYGIYFKINLEKEIENE